MLTQRSGFFEAAIHLNHRHGESRRSILGSALLAGSAALKWERSLGAGWRRSATGQNLPVMWSRIPCLDHCCSDETGHLPAVARWMPVPRSADACAGTSSSDLLGGTAFVKRRRSRGVRLEDALDDDAVEVRMRIEQRAKAVDEG